jgi:hypothetical protein
MHFPVRMAYFSHSYHVLNLSTVKQWSSYSKFLNEGDLNLFKALFILKYLKFEFYCFAALKFKHGTNEKIESFVRVLSLWNPRVSFLSIVRP